MATQGKTSQRLSASYLGNRKFSIAKTLVPGKRNSAGVGYLMVPLDIDRDLWIKTCYKKGQVSLLSENERIDNVIISKHIFQDLKFPINSKSLGTKIVWVSTPKNVIAIAIINGASEIVEISNDKVFNIIKKNGKNSSIEISGNVEDGFLNINIDSKSNSSGKLLLNIINKNNKGELNILVNGKTILESNYLENNILENFILNIQNLSVDSVNKTQIKYERTIGFSYIDEFGNTIVIDKNGKFTIKNKTYSLTDLFNDIITQISAITVATAIGVQPILNKVQVEDLKNKVTQILK